MDAYQLKVANVTSAASTAGAAAASKPPSPGPSAKPPGPGVKPLHTPAVPKFGVPQPKPPAPPKPAEPPKQTYDVVKPVFSSPAAEFGRLAGALLPGAGGAKSPAGATPGKPVQPAAPASQATSLRASSPSAAAQLGTQAALAAVMPKGTLPMYGAYVLGRGGYDAYNVATGKVNLNARAADLNQQGYADNVMANLTAPGEAAIDLARGTGDLIGRTGAWLTGTGEAARGAQLDRQLAEIRARSGAGTGG